MSNINYLNFRKCPTIPQIAQTAHAYLTQIFPSADILATPEGDDGFTVYLSGAPILTYWKESRRKISTTAPHGDWACWMWYMLRRHLIEVYGGTCRDEFDLSVSLPMTEVYPTYESYVRAMYTGPMSEPMILWVLSLPQDLPKTAKRSTP